MTLLLIDDDEISREVMAALLAELGVELIAAADGAAALAMIGDGSVAPDGILPDGILLDAQLPGLSGVALVAALRGVCAAPVVVFSASGISAELAEAADGFLQKSAEPEAILAAFEAAAGAAREGRTKIAAPATGAVIDAAVMGKFRMSAAALRRMYAALDEDCARRIELLAAAMHAGDRAAVRAEAHAIKGGAAMLGARGLRDVAGALELEADPAEWPRALAALREAMGALRALLEDASFDFAAPSG